MAHAGITPQWDLQTAKECARDVEAVLSSDSYPFFLDAMYGDMPNNWSPELRGLGRLRFITNAFTRMKPALSPRHGWLKTGSLLQNAPLHILLYPQ